MLVGKSLCDSIGNSIRKSVGSQTFKLVYDSTDSYIRQSVANSTLMLISLPVDFSIMENK